ncbi:MAG: hypothetical protein K8W52_17815, partial [Deltaproteobacteria bacterium]|nr:hypothetical protein [Deltaproteobacteria bacterium]
PDASAADAAPDAAPDAAVDAPAGPDSAPDAVAVPLAGFGDLSGLCGILEVADLTGPTPELFRDTLTFQRRYVDPDDRPLLTPGGLHLAETPNAGGSSGFSEIFAYEELARCELATFLKTETEIVYDTAGKITDLEVEIDGHKIGVSVTRAVAFPFGDPYTLTTASALLTKKLGDIQLSTANVSAADKWDKQILAVLAWDDQAADTIEQAWTALDPSVKADTIVIVTSTAGDDLFIYTNQ